MAGIFPCRDVELVAQVPLADMGGGGGLDIWGWTDPLTGTEYALMGTTAGTAFVDLSDPRIPVHLGLLPGQGRDMKVFADHAFIVDQIGSVVTQIFDLTQLRDVVDPPQTFTATATYPNLENAHNLALNEETGFAYAADGTGCGNGVHMFDVNDPLVPFFVGCTTDGNTHDSQCVIYNGPDVEHRGKEICFNSNRNSVGIVDVTVKSAPVTLSTTPHSPNVHQGWLMEDHTFFLFDDEFDESTAGLNTRTWFVDVTDLDQPVRVGAHVAETTATDHNLFVHDGLVYQANYRAGFRLLTIDNPVLADMTEIAFLDTHPESDAAGTSQGAWGVYPFFASGLVIVSDRGRGLFVLRHRTLEMFSDGFESGDLSAWNGSS